MTMSTNEKAQSLCERIGFEMILLDSWEEIPEGESKEPREFEDILHVGDAIWVSTDLLGEEAVWHEVGHAMVSFLLGEEAHRQMLRNGEHWIVEDRWVSDEDPACSAAHALALACGVSHETVISMDKYVNYDPEQDADLDRWAQMAEDMVQGCSLQDIQNRYQDLEALCRQRSEAWPWR